jgi:hypothetical protein
VLAGLAAVVSALIVPPVAGRVTAAAVPAAAQARPQAGTALPAAAWAPVSRALGRDDPAYHAATTTRGLTAANPRQRLQARFSRGGVRVGSGSLVVGLVLRGVGYGPRLAAVPAAAPVAAGNRVTFRHEQLAEWFVNGPLGLEQGFTLTAPPTGQAGGPLTLAMTLSGNARAALTPGGQAAVFTGAGSALAYRGLAASDARGRPLPAWLGLQGRQLLLHVQARGARYPLTLDPVIQQARLTASDGAANDGLGYSVAISANGNTIVAAAPFTAVNGNQSQGAVYVFTKPPGGWQDATQTAKLTASDGAAGDGLGSGFTQGQNGVAVSADGNTIVAGAPGLCFACAPGAVYVFTKPAGGWRDETQAAKLTASDAGPHDNLGSSVAISGNVIASGAPDQTINGNQIQGAVYVFTKPAGGWRDETQAAKLIASDGAQLDGLGNDVGISGGTVVSGAPSATVNGNSGQGAAYVFTKPAGGWRDETQAAKLTASDGTAGDGLGLAIGMSGKAVLVGAPNANQFQGAAYIFVKPSGGWRDETQTAKLTTTDSTFLFGYSVAIAGRTAIAGGTDPSGNGTLWVYAEPPGGWQNQTQLTEITNPDFLAFMEALSRHTLAAGAPIATVNGNDFQGAIDVYPIGPNGVRRLAAAQASAVTPPRPAPCLALPRPGAPPHPMRWQTLGTRIRCR